MSFFSALFFLEIRRESSLSSIILSHCETIYPSFNKILFLNLRYSRTMGVKIGCEILEKEKIKYKEFIIVHKYPYI